MAEKYSHDEVKQKVIDLLCDISGEDDVADNMDTDLFEEGYLDSMGAIELLVAIEESFGVEIAPTAVEREEMNTVNKIVHQVQIRL